MKEKERKQIKNHSDIKDKVREYLLSEIKKEKRSIEDFERYSEKVKLKFLEQMQDLESPSQWIIENLKQFNQNLQMFKMLMLELNEDTNPELVNLVTKEIECWEDMIEHDKEHIEKEKVKNQSKKEEITKQYEQNKAHGEKLLKYNVDRLEKYKNFLQLLGGGGSPKAP